MSSAEFGASVAGPAAAALGTAQLSDQGRKPHAGPERWAYSCQGDHTHGASNPEQALDHGHAGQGSQREPLPRTGRRAPAEQHPMALLPVEPGQVELARQIQHVQLDPVLEGLAGQPQRPCAKQDETVSEAAPQHDAAKDRPYRRRTRPGPARRPDGRRSSWRANRSAATLEVPLPGSRRGGESWHRLSRGPAGTRTGADRHSENR